MTANCAARHRSQVSLINEHIASDGSPRAGDVLREDFCGLRGAFVIGESLRENCISGQFFTDALDKLLDA